MTKLLSEAFNKLQQLPEFEQDEIARQLLEEFESERRWDALFEASPAQLETLADEALAEHRAGRTLSLNPEAM